jgi:hypothetical protein
MDEMLFDLGFVENPMNKKISKLKKSIKKK